MGKLHKGSSKNGLCNDRVDTMYKDSKQESKGIKETELAGGESYKYNRWAYQWAYQWSVRNGSRRDTACNNTLNITNLYNGLLLFLFSKIRSRNPTLVFEEQQRNVTINKNASPDLIFCKDSRNKERETRKGDVL